MSTQPTSRKTVQGSAVRDALAGIGGFCSAQQVYARMRASGHMVGLTTVYRHLQSLADSGSADMIRTADGEATYRMCGWPSDRHHHHLVCRHCGRAEEIEGPAVERWAASVAEQYGFTNVEHTIEVFGTCADCAASATAP